MIRLERHVQQVDTRECHRLSHTFRGRRGCTAGSAREHVTMEPGKQQNASGKHQDPKGLAGSSRCSSWRFVIDAVLKQLPDQVLGILAYASACYLQIKWR